MMANLMLGNSLATVASALDWSKPTASTGSKPRLAKVRSACSIWLLFCGSKPRTSMPVALVNAVAPWSTPSLKLLSNLPPRSNTIAGFGSAARAG